MNKVKIHSLKTAIFTKKKHERNKIVVTILSPKVGKLFEEISKEPLMKVKVVENF